MLWIWSRFIVVCICITVSVVLVAANTTVQCDGSAICACGSVETGPCTLDCKTISQACKSAQLDCRDGDACTIDCDGSQACRSATINCPLNAVCTLLCGGGNFVCDIQSANLNSATSWQCTSSAVPSTCPSAPAPYTAAPTTAAPTTASPTTASPTTVPTTASPTTATSAPTPPVCHEVLLVRDAIDPVFKNQYLGDIPINDEMHFEFDIVINEFPSTQWSNVFHCGLSDENRKPAIYLRPSWMAAAAPDEYRQFLVQFSAPDTDNSYMSPGPNLTTNELYHFEMDVDQSSMMISINGSFFGISAFPVHANHATVQCYASDPWWPAANVWLTNLLISTPVPCFACSDPNCNDPSVNALPACDYAQLSDFSWVDVGDPALCIEVATVGVDQWFVKFACDALGNLLKYEYAMNDACGGSVTQTTKFWAHRKNLVLPTEMVWDFCCPVSEPVQTPTLTPIVAPTAQPTTPPPTMLPTRPITAMPAPQPPSQQTYLPTPDYYYFYGANSPFLPDLFQSLPSTPTLNPSPSPTSKPTSAPFTIQPTNAPFTSAPTQSPTLNPTESPTKSPTHSPSVSPSQAPSVSPSRNPTSAPSSSPTASPIAAPTVRPSEAPTTTPTDLPTLNPTTWSPTRTGETRPPTPDPTAAPTNSPTVSPTGAPSLPPTDAPTGSPTADPSASPTEEPTTATSQPSVLPTAQPSDAPTQEPTTEPTVLPSSDPSASPSEDPSNGPSAAPTPTPLLIDANDDDDQGQDDDNSGTNSDRVARIKAARAAALKAVKAQVMPSVPVHAICLCLVMVFFVLIVRHFFGKHKPGDDKQHRVRQKSIKITVMVTFIASIITISSLLVLSLMIVTAEQWNIDMYQKTLIPYNFVARGYFVSKASLESFFILRAYNTFKDSAFGLRKRTVVFLFIVLSLIALSWMFATVRDDFSQDYVYLILSSADALFTTTLLLIFVVKLNKLVMMQKSELSSEMSSNSNTVSQSPTNLTRTATVNSAGDAGSDIEPEMHRTVTRGQSIKAAQKSLVPRQTKLIAVMTRCVVLSSIAFLSTILFGFFSFYYVRYGAELYLLYSAWSLDVLVNCVCLFLNFAFAGSMYHRCCGCCHQRCQGCIEYCAARQIVREHGIEMQVAAGME